MLSAISQEANANLDSAAAFNQKPFRGFANTSLGLSCSIASHHHFIQTGRSMSGPNEISVEKLAKLIGTATSPRIIDVRLDEDFELDRRLLPISKRVAHNMIQDLPSLNPTAHTVVVCQRGAKLSHGAAAILRLQGHDAVSLEGGFEAWRDAQQTLMALSAIPFSAVTGKTLWVTRHRPKIDRIACPWLLRRFVDRDAAFLFVPPEHVEGVAERFNATAFDMPTGFWTHEGERCTFDKMLEVFTLETPALLHLARIVRAADTNNLSAEPEAAGLLAISLGLSRQYSNDGEQLEAGMAIYDALYRWCRDATDETHNWPAVRKVSK
jgi:rhodanese-related sulfurtransferase